MDLATALATLEAKGSEKVRAMNAKNGADENQFGCKLGDIRAVAKAIKTDHALALELWKTGNLDARYLAILIIRPNDLGADDLDKMVRQNRFAPLADWLNSYVVKQRRDKEDLRQRWLADSDPMAARSGWSLTAEKINKDPDGLDIPALLERIETEMPKVAPEQQWTMNMSLAYIGIEFPQHRTRALKIGETLGVYRDYPVSKGCTSPFAPEWINEMVRRQSPAA